MGGMDDSLDRDPFDLSRFVTAQNADVSAASGPVKRMFPQVSGLGRSAVAKHFELSGVDEAKAYLAHPVLGPRLRECARAMAALAGRDAVAVLGPVDATKVRSSMTLFGYVDPEPVFAEVLDRYFAGERDQETLRRL